MDRAQEGVVRGRVRVMASVSAPPTTLAELLRSPRYEVLPLDGVEEAVLAHVPQDVTLTVTVSPSRGISTRSISSSACSAPATP